MRVRLLVGCGLTLGILAQVAPAGATPFTWQFSGTVTNIYRPTGVNAQLGTTVTFTATFDDAAPDQCGSTTAGFYSLSPGTVSFNGETHTSLWNALEVNNPLGSCPQGDAESPQDVTLRYVGFAGAPTMAAALGWVGGPEIGDGMPSLFPNLIGAHFLLGDGCTICYGIQGEITSVHAVPEPATLALTATGIAVLWSRRRHRRRRH